MKAQKNAGLMSKGGGDQKSNHRVAKKPGDAITLAEVGIDKSLADRSQKWGCSMEPRLRLTARASRWQNTGVKAERHEKCQTNEKIRIRTAAGVPKP